MTRPKSRPASPVDAVREALDAAIDKRGDTLKPIEIVKVAISAYQAYASATDVSAEPIGCVSDDALGIVRGKQSSVDRLLFNANYWLAAYESRISAACESAKDARTCFKAVAVWNTHTLKLNTLGDDEVVETFERFCPPFASNNRKGAASAAAGRGPIADFARTVESIAEHASPKSAESLRAIVADMQREAAAYESLAASSALDAFFDILPAWCLADHIPLVQGSWWDDSRVMLAIADALCAAFERDGYGEATCCYFHDSFSENIDIYQREVTSESSRFASLSIPDLIELVHAARAAHSDYETDGYGETLPSWLIAKEQLIWNTIACAIYGPSCARPLLADTVNALPSMGQSVRDDIITKLARSSFARYKADRAAGEASESFESFSDQPADLRASSIEHIRSIPKKIEVLGYEIVPAGSCYPEQRVTSFSQSEVECLAILEHRRWIAERVAAGWTYAHKKDVEAKTSPYLVPWEELPERAREWNRSAIRNTPALLAAEGLAIAR